MTDSLGRILHNCPDAEAYLAAEGAGGARFAELEHAAADMLHVSFNGRSPLVVGQGDTAIAFSDDASPAAAATLTDLFELSAQQSRGAWWLPEETRITVGMINLPAYYVTTPRWAMTRAGDDHGRYPLADPSAFASWSCLAPLAADLLEPLTLRGPEAGTLSADDSRNRWQFVRDRYFQLGIATPEVSEALKAMQPGNGWTRLRVDQQLAAKRHLIACIGQTISADVVTRWRAHTLAPLIARYYAKAKKGPPESRAVLVKAVQPTLAAFFGGDWLSFVNYLGEQPADSETIITGLPDARLYVEASAKVAQVAAAQGLPVSEVAKMLGSYLGTDAVVSPVQRRVEVIKRYWHAMDDAQADQRSGSRALNSLVESQVPNPGGPEHPFTDPPADQWVPAELQREIAQLWAGVLIPSKPDRIVSSLSPYWAMKQATGPALWFWYELGLSCWYICEGPSARTDLAGLASYYAREVTALAQAGTPIDDALFAELAAAETRLGKLEPMLHDQHAIDAGHGITVTFSMGGGFHRDGFEILRDILTRHRRAWSGEHLDTAIRAGWEVPLRDLAEDVNRAVAARGKLPTARQLAGLASKAANAWFGGDLSATLAAIGEKPVSEQTSVRLLPDDRYEFCRRVFTGIGGHAVSEYQDPNYSAQYTRLSLAANAVRVVQKQELLGREPDPKEAGYATYQNWPEGIDYPAYLAAIRNAREGTPSRHLTAVDGLVTDVSREAGNTPTAQKTPAAETAGSSNQDPGGARSGESVPPAGAAPRIEPNVPLPAWYPDTNAPGTLRWWDGTHWSSHTAPGANAAPGWFTDPKQPDRLRWWNGAQWTETIAHLDGRAPPPAHTNTDGRHRAAPTSPELPPWEVDGLPFGLVDADFSAARRVAQQLTTTETTGQRTYEPATGPWAKYFTASGTQYPENEARLRRLLAREPIARTPEGWCVYPAILVPDPSRSDSTTVPIGACSEVGYVGSAWCSLATSWARRVAESLPHHRLVVTRLAVWPDLDSYEISAQIWLPTLDPPPWLT